MLLVRPLNFAVVDASETAIAPALNARNDEAGLVWQTDAAAPYAVLDMFGKTYDTVALIGCTNAGNEINIRTGTTEDGTGRFYQAVSNTNQPVGSTKKFIAKLPQMRGDRYVRIDLPDASDSFTAQRIVVGKALDMNALAGVEYGAEQTFVDQSIAYSGAGWESFEELPVLMQWKVSISFVNDAVWRESWVPFFNQVGKHKGVLFVPDADSPQTWQNDAIFGRIRNEASAKVVGYDARTIEIIVRSLSA